MGVDDVVVAKKAAKRAMAAAAAESAIACTPAPQVSSTGLGLHGGGGGKKKKLPMQPPSLPSSAAALSAAPPTSQHPPLTTSASTESFGSAVTHFNASAPFAPFPRGHGGAPFTTLPMHERKSGTPPAAGRSTRARRP